MRTWPLTLTVATIVLLSLVVDVLGFLRFAPAIGLPWWAAIVCVLPMKAVEWFFLVFARRLWAAGWVGKLLSSAAVIVWCMAVALSALAGNATIFTLLASADHSAAKKAETRANVKLSLAGIDAQLASLSKLGVPRPVSTVQEALDWIALPQAIRHATQNCGRIEQDHHRRVCKDALALRKEFAASRDYEHLRVRAEVLRSQLAALEIKGDSDPMPRAFELLFGGLVKLEGKDGIAFMVMLILALVSALGPFSLDILKAHQRQEVGRTLACPGSPGVSSPEGGQVAPPSRRESCRESP